MNYRRKEGSTDGGKGERGDEGIEKRKETSK